MTGRERLYFAGVLALLALVALVTTCMSCATHMPRPSGRTLAEQHRSAVTLRISCLGRDGHGSGSGVVVSKSRVLTAAHVVMCEVSEGSNVYFEGVVTVNPGDGKWRSAKVAAVDIEADVAAIEVEGIEAYATPVEVAQAPEMGGLVCMASGSVPGYVLKCGMVQPGNGSSDVIFDVVVIPGNSGSGLYDGRGRLVGIVVRLRACGSLRWFQACDGIAVPIAKYRTLLGL